MAVSRSSSPSKRPSDEEQLLPAYEQFPFTSSQASNTLPEETATPEQICDFLVQLLTTKRGISTEHASRIASKWTISSGKELRSFPPAMFTEIFGREDGYIVYREVKTLVYQLEIDEKKEKKEQRTTQKRVLDGESYQPIIRSNMPHETNSLLFFLWQSFYLCLLSSVRLCSSGPSSTGSTAKTPAASCWFFRSWRSSP
jgi:hypothetical protein